jgi:tRNA 2-thiocytidine biosynthesis protein TtcA
MAYVKEEDTTRWAAVKKFPIIPCDLCGSQENLQRKQIKALMREWDKKFPGRVENMFAALSNVVPSHLLDRELFPFSDLRADGRANPNGDIAFDEEPCAPLSDIVQLITP